MIFQTIASQAFEDDILSNFFALNQLAYICREIKLFEDIYSDAI